MTTDDLRQALASGDGVGVATCLVALDEPDAAVHIWPDQRPVPTSNLLTIYRRRAAHTESIGLPTLGFREALQRLEETPHETLRLAEIWGASDHPWCVVFLAPQEPVMVACLVVLGL